MISTVEEPGTAASPDPCAMCDMRLASSRAVLARVEAQAKRISDLRLIGFLIVVAAGIFALWTNLPEALAGVALSLAALVAIIVWHEIVIRRGVEARRRVQYWSDCVDRMNHRWAGRGISGDAFLDEHHLYAADLDLFGKGSLFELVCSARTALGESCLAEWFLSPATPAQALERQQAVRELVPHHDLREDLAMLGPDVRAYVHANALVHWGTGVRTPFAQWERSVAKILPVFTLGAGAVTFFFGAPLSVAMLAVLLQVSFAVWLRTRVQMALAHVDFAARDLSILSLVLRRFESESFRAPLLKGLRKKLEAGGAAPSARIARLSRISELLDSRLNQAFGVLAPALLWSTNCAMAIEAWRTENGSHLAEWLNAVGELEALASLSRYAFEHPGDCWPDFDEEGKRYAASALAHPLIDASVAVPNDVSLDEQQCLLIVSGSNMSGKSTLLRAVGLSVVMALAGAPVRARSLRLAPFRLGTSIRVSDNLQEGESRFYAEIRRVRDVLELARTQPPALFLLDEIFSGTNSHDRRIGAQAILRSLVERGATGLVTTHDLALTRVEESLAGRARNVHFEDTIVDGRVLFDYRMREGVVTRSNALELMRSIGIEL